MRHAAEPDHPPPSQPRDIPWVTACICTHNRVDYLRDCLDGLSNQSVGPHAFSILVVDSGSAPEPAAALAAELRLHANARLLRLDQPGLSLARNHAARAAASAGADYIAYLDDDAIPAPDWIAAIQRAVTTADPRPAMLGGRICPLWEAPLPAWWPARLRGVLTIIEQPGTAIRWWDGAGETPEPYGANMIVHVPDLLAMGGFPEQVGRSGASLLSDEERVLSHRLRDAGHPVGYDARIVVHHQIQAERLTVGWLLARMYWQGISRVRSGRMLGDRRRLRREAWWCLRVFMVLAPVRLLPRTWPWLMPLRWRWAYASGFMRAFFNFGTGMASR